ncbi:hypothetical protein HDU76_012871 [Blyttiomyces sp. JEL0837]|nr:hypothetical protein HDU76_012871 [Blyttiomyces sp. JEL0837]
MFVDQGGKWDEVFYKSAAVDTSYGSAQMGCDWGKLKTPFEVVTVKSINKYKVAIQSKDYDKFVEGPQPIHKLFQKSLEAVGKFTKRDARRALVVSVEGEFGTNALFLSTLHTEVHNFEPVLENMRILRCSGQVNHFQNLHLQRVALSNETSVTKVCLKDSVTANRGVRNMKKNNNEKCNEAEFSEVRSITLDRYWKKVLKQRRPALMKLDINGQELKTLEGSKTMFEKSPPFFIFSEIKEFKDYTNTTQPQTKKQSTSPKKFISSLETLGYRAFDAKTLAPVNVNDKNWVKSVGKSMGIVFVNGEILSSGLDIVKLFK